MDTQTELGEAILKLRQLTDWSTSECADKYLSNDPEAMWLLSKISTNGSSNGDVPGREHLRRSMS